MRKNYPADGYWVDAFQWICISAIVSVIRGWMPEKFVLIGSGLAGGLLAAYLGRRGYEVELYERRSDPRAGNFVGGRSINLALSTRGIHALEQLGLAGEVLGQA
ncbi:MAG TPA: NAD(P)-binding protein, partial [Chthoniobacterales bacterium]|nr:NAD(P)-binding protein [Chthoniobacterales bacterium]